MTHILLVKFMFKVDLLTCICAICKIGQEVVCNENRKSMYLPMSLDVLKVLLDVLKVFRV
jgi:hypothetical protein